jgi:hypothetical protein
MFNKGRQAGKETCPQADEGIGTQAGWVLPPLSFQTNDQAAQQPHADTQGKLKR